MTHSLFTSAPNFLSDDAAFHDHELEMVRMEARQDAVLEREQKEEADMTADERGDVLFERDEKDIVTVTLKRAGKMNSMTRYMADRFESEVRKRVKEDDLSMRVMILTGHGNAFCSGGDLRMLVQRIHNRPIYNSALMRRFYECWFEIIDVPVPTIAAINGIAYGAGACLSMACDLRICARKTKIVVDFPAMHPGMAGEFLLRHIVGEHMAKRILYLEPEMTGERAFELGLITELVDKPEDVMPKAREWAEKLQKRPAIAMRTTTRTLRQELQRGIRDALTRESNAQCMCMAEPDYARTILEKQRNVVLGKKKKKGAAAATAAAAAGCNKPDCGCKSQ